MVDVSGKPDTDRTAVAEGRVIMSRSTLNLVLKYEGDIERAGEKLPDALADKSAGTTAKKK